MHKSQCGVCAFLGTMEHSLVEKWEKYGRRDAEIIRAEEHLQHWQAAMEALRLNVQGRAAVTAHLPILLEGLWQRVLIWV